MNNNLEELVTRYGNMKAEMDSYKKQVDADNTEIKSIMSSNLLSEARGGGYVAKYTVIVSESFDEEKLIEKLNDMDFMGKKADEIGLIEYVPKVNMEALENAIYSGKLNAAELADCRIKKVTPRLTITKEKKNAKNKD